MEKSRRLTDLAQLPENARVGIYGAGGRGARVLRAIRAFRSDVQVPFFVDTFTKGTHEGLPILGPQEFERRRHELDLIIVASMAEYKIVMYLLSVGVENLMLASQFFCSPVCYPSREAILTREYHTVLDALERPEDKEFFAAFTDIMRVTDSVRRAEDAVYDKYFTFPIPYCQHLRKQAVRYMLDVGLGIGHSSMAFCHAFPEAPIYAFDPEPENYRYGLYYDYLHGLERFNYFPLAVSDSVTELRFSTSDKVAGKRTYGKITDNGERVVRTTTIDSFVESQGLGQGGFIKIMVNGYEHTVVQGALKTLRELRPQMAIHMYAMGMAEDPAFQTMSFCVEFLQGYRFLFSHITASEKHSIFYCIPEELA